MSAVIASVLLSKKVISYVVLISYGLKWAYDRYSKQTNVIIIDDDVEAFDDRHLREYGSVAVDPDHDFSNQDRNRGELVPYEVDFEDEVFDDQVFIPSSSSSSEEQSPYSFVDDPSKEVNPLSIAVDNWKESITVDVISPPNEEKKKKSDLIKEEIWMKHYCSSHKILLVGEGDFSFSACLANAFGKADNMVATSLNPEAFLKEHYWKAMSNINSLRSRGCKVIHKVDATVMAGNDYLLGVKYDRIVYNFPLAGFFPNESPKVELRMQQNLVRQFMVNAKKMVAETGEIHISHKCNGFFQEWELEKLAKKSGLVLIEEVKFNLSDYPGYNTKYGFGGDKNFDCNPSMTYKFGLKKRVSEW